MKLQEQIDERLMEIYKEFKDDRGDLTGWSLNQKLKEEAKNNEGLFDYFNYRIQKIAYENNEIISCILFNFLLYPFFEEEYILNPSKIKSEDKDFIEFLPRVFFKKGIKTKVLEALGLNKTLKAYYYYLLCIEKEIGEKNYLKNEEISKFSNWESASNGISNILRSELKEKFGEEFEKRHRIFKFNLEH